MACIRSAHWWPNTPTQVPRAPTEGTNPGRCVLRLDRSTPMATRLASFFRCWRSVELLSRHAVQSEELPEFEDVEPPIEPLDLHDEARRALEAACHLRLG